LLSIAVAPAYRSRGIGRDLSDAVIDALSRRGVREVKVVVGSDNDGANRFYRDLGFTRAAETQVHRGVSSNVMVVACPR
jgi:ribosomal protein S18 acetylase RimI-like enzyme